ncbi:hypothetical protein SDJN03_27734, partial [Cucurbita argyrosperma subsp. sororia]
MATSRAMLNVVSSDLAMISNSSPSTVSFPVIPTPSTSTTTFDGESTPSTYEATTVVGSGSAIFMSPTSNDFVAFEVPNGMDAKPPMSNRVIRSCKPKGRMRYSAPSDRRNSLPLVSIVCSNMS